MIFDEVNYNQFNDVPYLGITEPERDIYNTDLSNSFDNSYNELHDKIKDLNLIINNDSDYYNKNIEIIIDDYSLNDLTQPDNNRLFVNKSLNEIQFMQKVSNRLKNLKNNNNNNRLINQILNGSGSGVNKTKGELEILNEQIKNLENKNEIKKRQVQISEYYKKKRKHQIEVFQNMCIILFILFIFGLLFQFKIINETLFVGIIGTGIAILVIYGGYVSFDMMYRDKTNYDEYIHTIIPSKYYLNNTNANHNNIPLYKQKDLVSNKCYLSDS